MGVAMTENGSVLMNLGTAVGWIVLVLIALVVLGVLVLVLLSRVGHKEQVLAFVQRLVPSLTRLNKKLSASRVSSVLSMMLSSGFPMEEALEMTGNVLSDREAAEQVKSIRTGLEEGKTFADAVSDTGLFDELHTRMIRMGSATGHEDQVLGKLSELYEEQVENDITRLIAIIEPTLVALLAVVIGAVLLSVMLPMAGILTSL
jgi:type IV pilus assembly protein PilC